MIQVGDDAPDFTAPVATGDLESFTLSKNLDDAPLVLAFFPAAFTGVCTTEMCTFDDMNSRFEDVGATVYGVSVDSPFALNEFRYQEGFQLDMISDFEKEIIDVYGVRTDFADLGVHNLAQRSVFIVDDDGSVTYRWIAKNAGQEPDYDDVEQAAADAAN